jgi:signal transduction histidine kinase
LANPAAIPSLPWSLGAAGRAGTGSGRYPWFAGALILAADASLAVIVQWPNWADRPALSAVNLAVSLLFVLTGLLITREDGQRAVGCALILTGIFRPLDFIDAWAVGPFPLYSLIFGGIDRVFGVWALLRYPSRTLSRNRRLFIIAFAGWMLVTRALVGVTATPQWEFGAPVWMPQLLPSARLATVLSDISYGGEGLFGLAVIVLLVIRLTGARRLDRVVLAPIVTAGIAAGLAAIASGATQQVIGQDAQPGNALFIEGLVDIALPLAFLVAAVQRALLIRNITWLVGEISGALRATLEDPTLDVIDLSPAAGDGPTVGAALAAAEPDAELPGASPPEPGRLREFVYSESGEPIAVIIADAALERYRGLFDVAVRTSELALQTAQAQAAAAQAMLAEVQASRARIIEAAQAERQRIERDLHDGVQQRILSLAAQLSAAVASSADPAAAAAFARVREGMKEILAELRELAHGIYPTVLTEAGLGPALEEVADRLPIPVRIEISGPRLAAAAEAGLYFVACEALANVVKHAHATRAAVTVTREESTLALEIADNGVGGAGAPGRGLANIADRVSALDGRLVIDSPAGGGTRLEVTIPCG